jgi:hypothetical protein
MLRFISLVTVRDGTDVDAIVEAGAAMCRDDPDIEDGTVAAGLGLMRAAGAPEASYAMVLDFVDADAMDRWAVGPAHQELLQVVGDAVESFVVAEVAI